MMFSTNLSLLLFYSHYILDHIIDIINRIGKFYCAKTVKPILYAFSSKINDAYDYLLLSLKYRILIYYSWNHLIEKISCNAPACSYSSSLQSPRSGSPPSIMSQQLTTKLTANSSQNINLTGSSPPNSRASHRNTTNTTLLTKKAT